MKNRKGFTLVELLVTISIIAIVLVIAVPASISLLAKNTEKQYTSYVDQFTSSAKLYIDENKDIVDNLKKGTQSFEFITLKELGEKEFLGELPTNPKTDEKFNENSGVKITYNASEQKLEYVYVAKESLASLILEPRDVSLENNSSGYNLLTGLTIIDENGNKVDNNLFDDTKLSIKINNGSPSNNTNFDSTTVGKYIIEYSYEYSDTQTLIAQRTISVGYRKTDIIKLEFEENVAKQKQYVGNVDIPKFNEKVIAHYRDGSRSKAGDTKDKITCSTAENMTVNTSIYNVKITCKVNNNINSDNSTPSVSINIDIIKYLYEAALTNDNKYKDKDSNKLLYINSGVNYVTWKNKTWRIVNIQNGLTKILLQNYNTDFSTSYTRYVATGCCDNGHCSYSNANIGVSGLPIGIQLTNYYNTLNANADLTNYLTNYSWSTGYFGKIDDRTATSYVGTLNLTEYETITELETEEKCTGILNSNTTNCKNTYASAISGYPYWLLTSVYNNYLKYSNSDYYNHYYVNANNIYVQSRTGSAYVRPAVVFKKCVKISGGNGTSSNPYVISGGC